MSSLVKIIFFAIQVRDILAPFNPKFDILDIHTYTYEHMRRSTYGILMQVTHQNGLIPS